MSVNDLARSIERGINKRGIVRKRRQGWIPKILPFTGYGSAEKLHVLARAVMAPPVEESFATAFHEKFGPVRPVSYLFDIHTPTVQAIDHWFGATAGAAAEAADEAQRGWRQFFTTQVGNLPCTVEIAGRKVTTRTDSNGYINVLLADHGLAPGWHEARITPLVGASVRAQVMIVSQATRIGIVSDIDDTIVVTMLPRVLHAAWNSFVLKTDARTPVPGMAQLLQRLCESFSAPLFYLSTGAWNTLPAMQEFIKTHDFPSGPLLMTDWGPTPTGLFRNGEGHKRMQLRNLIITFPEIKWILVGDDGQHDMQIYEELAREHPTHVAAIALRELDAVEHVLSSGVANAFDMINPVLPARMEDIPLVRGANGHVLAQKLFPLLSDFLPSR